MVGQYIRSYYDLAVNTYHVNPVVFLILYLGAVPFFYLSIFFVLREVVRLRKTGRRLTLNTLADDRTLDVWFIVFVVANVLPYVYIAIWGRNVPLWVWIPILLVIAYAAYRFYQQVRVRRKKRT
jgi:hypothetical protein